MVTARDLSNASYMRGLTDDHLRATIRDGRPPNMPSFGDQLMQPSIELVVAHVRSLSDADAEPVGRAVGQEGS